MDGGGEETEPVFNDFIDEADGITGVEDFEDFLGFGEAVIAGTAEEGGL